jgi:hypothetical protein
VSAELGGLRQVADAVLYEGYLLYPYRATSRKNQMRWQFGVVAPREWTERGGSEHSWLQVECLLEPGGRPRVSAVLRFLQVQRRSVERADNGAFHEVPSLDVGGALHTAWDEGVEREVELAVDLMSGAIQAIPFLIPAGRDLATIATPSGEVAGRFVRTRWPIAGEIQVAVERVDAVSPLVKLRLRINNVTPCAAPSSARDDAMPLSLIGAHLLLSANDAAFVSMVDPPEWARVAARACSNVRAWPVLGGSQGEHQLLLAAPIILYDYPQIAPESPADLYDATEIDEILTLRTMTLTDEEKREARATDPRAAAIIDRVDHMTPEVLERLHGAVRSPAPQKAAWWDPGVDASVCPDTDTVDVGGVVVAKGSRVRLRPGNRRADAQDMFLAGRLATVEGVFLDVEDRRYVAVTVADDPGADLHAAHGRYLYFYPDEIEPTDSVR